ncbi:putative NADH:flavin oxidoreductase [Castellaniella defragrans 65Phen]|nr:putative NADH:flavin oxidoreductase [Castellaniella defragrans 65Phen]
MWGGRAHRRMHGPPVLKPCWGAMSILFSPLRIGPMMLDNRVFVSPMCQYSARGGLAGDWHWQHYGSLAVGGAGALTLEATAVAPEGRITAGCLGLYDPRQEAALAALVAHLKRLASIPIGIQLSHAGRKAACRTPWDGGGALSIGTGWPVLGPSALPFGAERPLPVEMNEADIERVTEAFAGSARRALRAGLDYLELHLAHGYLLASFLSPLANRRTDAYGGALANRLRFPLAVAAAVRAVWPAHKALGARIDAHEWIEGGRPFSETLEVCAALRGAGVDFVCISSGAVAEGVRIPAAPGYLLGYAGRVRRKTGMPVRAVGMLHRPRMAERAVADGDADCVALGRSFLFDPRWAMKAAHVLGAGDLFSRQFQLAGPARWHPGRALAAALNEPA